MSTNTTTALQVAISQRDRLRAEYIAKSGLNLTRLLIAKEPQIRQVVAPLFALAAGPLGLSGTPPQLNVWDFAGDLLAPFSDLKGARESDVGVDFSQIQGLKETGGTFEIIALPENSMINLNQGLFFTGSAQENEGRKNIADNLYSLMGGLEPESVYEPMFTQLDADGQLTSRMDIVSNVIDWWDADQVRTVYDPGTKMVTSAGGEDDIYSQFADSYEVKNAPYDSLEELRLIRGFSDDFWATFIEPDPEDPSTRRVTVYGSGAINPNEAQPVVLLARVCSFVPEQPLCQDRLQQGAFEQLLGTARTQLMSIPVFAKQDDFIGFIEGKSKLYTLLAGVMQMFPGGEGLMMWTPIVVPEDKRQAMRAAFVMQARIFTIQSVGRVGNATVKLNTVVNFDEDWTPPPPNAGKMPGLGIFLRYRVD
jgi:general secretion pathway protein K